MIGLEELPRADHPAPTRSPPYFPLWARDFVHSCRITRMSPDEVGALVMLLCQQWENMGPVPKDPAMFAAYAGWDVRVARRLLARLHELKKIEETPAGIQSSRMRDEIAKYVAKVRAAEHREAERRKAKIDQTSSEHLSNFAENSRRSSAEIFRKSNEINVEPSTASPLPDSDTDSERKKVDIRAAEAAPIEDVFEQFWIAFPADRRRGKGKCRDLFRQIARGKNARRKASADEMLAAVRAGYGIDPNFPPMPETWLNQGRWEDAPKGAQAINAEPEPDPVNGKSWGWWRPRRESLLRLSSDRWEVAIANHPPNGTWPWWIFGPPPGHPECLMPPALVQKYGFAEIYRGKIHHA